MCDLHVIVPALSELLCSGLEGLAGDVGRPDLLSDPTRLVVLNIGSSDVVQYLRLACIDVTQNAANRGPEIVGRGRRFGLLEYYCHAFLVKMSWSTSILASAFLLASCTWRPLWSSLSSDSDE